MKKLITYIILICTVNTQNVTPTYTTYLSKELNYKTIYNDILILLNNILLKKITINHCYSLIVDKIYYDKLNNFFINVPYMEPYFLIQITESEDTLSPRYKIVKMLKEIRRTGCQLYIILVTNANQVERLLRFGDRYRILDTRAKFILLYDNRLFEQNLFYLWQRIVNVIFIKQYSNIRDANLKYGAWFQLSTVPFPIPLKNNLIVSNVDTWRLGKYRFNNVLFPDKTKNLKKQLVNIAVLEHTPAIRKVYTNEGHFIFSGLEIEIIKTLGYSMNFSYKFYQSKDSEREKWGKLQLNGSISGLLGEIIDGRAEFALGDLHYTPYHLDKMDLTIPYNTECLTFLTPETSTDNSWKTLILPFKPDMWAGVLSSLFSVGFVFFTLAKIHIYLNKINMLNKDQEETNSIFKTFLKKLKFYIHLKRNYSKEKELLKGGQLVPVKIERICDKRKEDLFDNFSNCILYTISMLLVVSLPRLPDSWSIRLLTGWYWLYCLLVVVAYRASMTAILASPAPSFTIDTLRELSDSKILCGAWGEQVREFFVASLDDALQKIGAKMEQVDDIDYAVQRIIKGEYAYYDNEYYLRKIRLSKYNLNNQSKQNNQQLHIMKECAIHMPISLGLHKNSPIKFKIDKILRRIIEAGLINKWLSDEINKLKSNKEMVLPKEALMDLKKFSSAFIAIAIGCCLSILSLLMEIIYFWKAN